MNIVIRIIYQGYEAKIMQQGEFKVNLTRFNEDPDQEAAKVAFEWMKQIRREGHVEEIVKVNYNEVNEITELVKKLDNVPFSNRNFPF